MTYTWMIFYKSYPDAAKAQTIKDAITYCLTEGQQSSAAMGYIPLPAAIVEKDKRPWRISARCRRKPPPMAERTA